MGTARLAVLGVAGLLALAGSAVAQPPGSPDNTPPTAPNANLLRYTATSVTLGFAATDDVGVDTYVITEGTRSWEQPASQSWERTLTDLTTNQTHTFTVRARDAAGNVSPPSNAVSVFIENQPPTPPRNLRVENDRLVWDAATDNSGTISRYLVFVDGVGRVGGRIIGSGGTFSTPLVVPIDPITGRPNPGPGTHSFTVKARDPAGNVSAASNAVTVEIP
jgi:chitodextrinase